MVLLLMVMPRSRSISIESRIWSRKSRASTPPVRWIRRSARVDFPWSIWAMMQKLRMSSKTDLPDAALRSAVRRSYNGPGSAFIPTPHHPPPLSQRSVNSSGGLPSEALTPLTPLPGGERGTKPGKYRGFLFLPPLPLGEEGRGGEGFGGHAACDWPPLQLQHHLDHVVLIAVGVRPVARDGVALEAEVFQGADGVGFGIGDQHAGQVAQAVGAGRGDEVVDQQGSQPGAAVGRIDEPLDAADQAQGAALATVQAGVGHDLAAVQRQQRQHLRVVELAAPALDQRPVVDAVPGEAADLRGQAQEELIE